MADGPPGTSYPESWGPHSPGADVSAKQHQHSATVPGMLMELVDVKFLITLFLGLGIIITVLYLVPKVIYRCGVTGWLYGGTAEVRPKCCQF